MKPDAALPRDPPAEDLLASMGIGPLLEPGRKLRITAEMRHKAERLRPIMRADLRRFLRRDSLEEARDLPDFDYDQALEHLTTLDPQERMSELAAAAQDEETAGLLVVGGRALQYLKGIVPSKSHVTITGPTPAAPSDYQKYRFRRAYAVLNDPREVTRDMNEGNLSRDQVRTLQTVYPTIYEEAEKALFEEMAIMKGENPKLEFTRDKVRQIENLWLTRSWTPDLGRAMQASFAQQQPQQQKPKALGNETDEVNATPIQRMESR
jgi:hypothetical protein